jgi:hypothetical protein
MKPSNVLVAAASLVLCAALPAQGCNLAITGAVNPGQSVTLAVTGATSGDVTLLAVADQIGSTQLNLGPLGMLNLGIQNHLLLIPIGITNSGGSLTRSISIPSNLPAAAFPSMDLQAQSVSVDVSFSAPTGGGGWGGFSLPTFSFCVSNVATLHIGP